jgi:hypothetical protein
MAKRPRIRSLMTWKFEVLCKLSAAPAMDMLRCSGRASSTVNVCVFIFVLYFELIIFVPSLFEVFVREEAMVAT